MEKLRFAEFEDSVNRTHQYTCLISDAEMLSYFFFLATCFYIFLFLKARFLTFKD